MATQDIKKLEETVKPVKRKTPEMEALLEVGYGMNLAQAKQIIKERDADPATHSYEKYNEAKAFIQAYETESRPVSNRKGWQRNKAR